ncbi:39S ribosomal protein L44, mitochondrial [Imshaugia aleurites]|uniref:Large ribosomal subunit protein mL53 n=1 Tax=Imshaugia aleurites TaxID=172621 RepID=A0A8H3FSF5_9LECA|nr:39S ribosomal protein L44, mitochondrial [Imshaugia aleurites]
MITKHITEVTTRFNPFTKPSKTCRVFLAHLPANARTTMKINTTVLNRDSQEPSFLALKFNVLVEDGKEMQLDTEKLNINDVVEEVDRHSRVLNRQADLAGN